MDWLNWLRSNSLRVYALALTLMIVIPVLLYPAAQTGSTNVIWFLIGMLALANLLILWME